MTKSKIYLDCCCFNRPYDKQNQLRISLETQAKVDIQHRIAIDEFELVVSTMLFHENSLNRNQEARSYIEHFMLDYGSTLVVCSSREVVDLRDEIASTGIKNADATHIASSTFHITSWKISANSAENSIGSTLRTDAFMP